METKATATLTTGEVAERAEVNQQTVRYYERRALIPEPPRTAAGYRQFDEGHVARIRFIKRAQELGFTLREVKELLALRADPQAPTRGQVRKKTKQKIAEVDAKMRDLQRIKDTLDGLVEACDGEGTASECPILQAFEAPAERLSEAPNSV